MSFLYQQDPKAFQYLSGVENVLWEQFLSVNQTGVVTNASLHSPLLPAKALVRNGQMAYCYGVGSHNGNVGAKTLSIRVNGSTVLGTFVLPASAGVLGWLTEIQIRRTSLTNITLIMQVSHNFNVLTAPGNTITVLGTTASFSPITSDQDLLIEFLATLAGAGDTIGQTLSNISCF
jgi:hypothetical protein